ncbi:hypothetical protein PISL3812_08915 [Talaromyces islandicus]|uniref:Uncharacterized protein n=1 Tax=Talaromyces islandicus TaxID=28573 RepID=A0A0U1M9Z1_TALIS|nr:hypothetical protein PISL3812_08915 [Talaromyces islandicus]
MAVTQNIPQFLLPRGISSRTLRYAVTAQAVVRSRPLPAPAARRGFSTSAAQRKQSANASKETKPRTLAQPDKFRPPSHPARRVLQTRDGRPVVREPFNYPGPALSAKEKEEQQTKRYPNMFPPEGTVMHKFLTTRWIHAWIALGVLTSLAGFTFIENFKRTSPFAHLMPGWSGLLSHPINTISQAISVWKMHVQHNSVLAREKRHKRIEDAEKRRQYRVAHGLEAPAVADTGSAPVEDDQSPVAAGATETMVEPVKMGAEAEAPREEYREFSGEKRPVKKWLGIW